MVRIRNANSLVVARIQGVRFGARFWLAMLDRFKATVPSDRSAPGRSRRNDRPLRISYADTSVWHRCTAGFPGCDLVFPPGPGPAAVSHLQTVTATGVGNTLSASLSDFGNRPHQAIVVAAEWGGNANVTLAGATFSLIESDILNPQRVATFFATGVNGPVTVTATLNAATTTEANLLVSAYDAVGGVPTQASSANGTGTAAKLTFPTSTSLAGDLLYSVAIARSGGSVLNGALLSGTSPNFTAEAGQGSYHLVQDYVLLGADLVAGQIDVTATNTSGTPTSLWHIFAMRLPHA